MTDLEYLRSRIPGYAGYANDDARHEVDKQMRAWLGEALTDARERLRPTGPVAEHLDGLLLRCEFSDQHAIRAADRADFHDGLADRLHALDRQLVGCGDALRALTAPDELEAELDAAARCLDQRSGAMTEAPSAP